jgi:Spy/CpxP family protein refolding chaperone
MRMPIGCVCIGLFAVFAAEGAFAQGGWRDMPPGKWWANKRFILQLRLSPDQQSRIESLWMQNRRNLMEWKSELEKRQLVFMGLLGKYSVDEATALRAFDRIQEARLNIERATFLMRIQIKNLLAPEQQQKLEAMSEVLRQQAARGVDAAPADSGPPAGKKGSPSSKKVGR